MNDFSDLCAVCKVRTADIDVHDTEDGSVTPMCEPCVGAAEEDRCQEQ